MPNEHDTIEFRISELKTLSFNDWNRILSSISALYNVLLINERDTYEKYYSEIRKWEQEIERLMYFEYEYEHKKHTKDFMITHLSNLDNFLEQSDKIEIIRMDVGSPDGVTGRGRKSAIDRLKEFIGSEPIGDDTDKTMQEYFDRIKSHVISTLIRNTVSQIRENIIWFKD